MKGFSEEQCLKETRVNTWVLLEKNEENNYSNKKLI